MSPAKTDELIEMAFAGDTGVGPRNHHQSSIINRGFYKKLSYRRGTARCVVLIETLPIATQQCRNYLFDKS